jgi:hypothetical protein
VPCGRKVKDPAGKAMTWPAVSVPARAGRPAASQRARAAGELNRAGVARTIVTLAAEDGWTDTSLVSVANSVNPYRVLGFVTIE